MLSTFNMHVVTEAYLQGSSLPLTPRPLGGGVLLHGFVGSTRGSKKVTCFAVFLELQGVGNAGTLRLSMWEVATRLGTLNSRIPSLS